MKPMKMKVSTTGNRKDYFFRNDRERIRDSRFPPKLNRAQRRTLKKRGEIEG